MAYNVVRSLAQKGIEVYPADFVPKAMSYFSRYASRKIVYPSPFHNQTAFVDKLIREIKRLQVDVLIPVYEELFVVSKHKDRLSQHVKMVVADYDRVLKAHNKDQWADLAREINIPVPKSMGVHALQETPTLMGTFTYPVLIKPKQGGGSWGIQQVDSKGRLERIIAEPLNGDLEWDRFFVQEKIQGESVCVAMLFNEGALRAKVAYQQLRDYPVTGGQATLRVSMRHEKAEKSFQDLLEAMQWHGVCQGDFIVDNTTGVAYLIDINPRLWGSLAQALACGIDFPYLIYRIAVDGDVKPQVQFKSGIRSRWMGGDLRTFLPLLRTSKAKKNFIKDFFMPPQRATLLDDISMEDPIPFVAWCADAVGRIIKNRSLHPAVHDGLDGIWE